MKTLFLLILNKIGFNKQSNNNQIKTKMKKPTIGRIVIFHTTEEQRNEMHRTGNPQNHLPALIVAVNTIPAVPAVEEIWRKVFKLLQKFQKKQP